VTSNEHETPLRPWQLFVLVSSLVAGIAAALAVMPLIFRIIPTDISRVGVILSVLRDSSKAPEIVAFGDSIVMSGIDAKRLRDELPGRPLAWNLSSTGQSLVETSLLAQELPASVKTIIYTTSLRPIAKETPLHRQKSNAYYLYGFRPTEETLDTLGEVYGEGVLALLSRSHLAQAFEGRWAVRQLLDTSLRILLRSDLSLAGAEVDLFHPQRYTEPIQTNVLLRYIDALLAQLEDAPPRVLARDRKLVRRLAEQAASEGRRTVVLVPPVHPMVRTHFPEAYAQGIAEVARALSGAPSTLLVDASALLAPEHFVDVLHPTNSGAARLSAFVAERIRTGF